jgi:hypothetical protein
VLAGREPERSGWERTQNFKNFQRNNTKPGKKMEISSHIPPGIKIIQIDPVHSHGKIVKRRRWANLVHERYYLT